MEAKFVEVLVVVDVPIAVVAVVTVVVEFVFLLLLDDAVPRGLVVLQWLVKVWRLLQLVDVRIRLVDLVAN